jgi:hypothetical protein
LRSLAPADAQQIAVALRTNRAHFGRLIDLEIVNSDRVSAAAAHLLLWHLHLKQFYAHDLPSPESEGAVIGDGADELFRDVSSCV